MALEIIGLGVLIVGVLNIQEFINNDENNRIDQAWEEYAIIHGDEKAEEERRKIYNKNEKRRIERLDINYPGAGLGIYF